MLAARPSTVPGRKQKMVYVDFSNPYTRNYLARDYFEAHRACLDGAREALPGWIAGAWKAEAAEAAAAGRAARPLAAVLDIDEVILSNIHMNSYAGAQGGDAVDFHAADYFRAPDGSAWPRGARLNPLLPGARELLDALAGHGLEVYFITGRLESIRAETVENFEHVGLAARAERRAEAGALYRAAELEDPAGRLVMCPDGEYPPPGGSVRPYKEERRRRIEETHRIVLNIGDQVSDLGLHGYAQVHARHIFYWTP